VPTTQRDSDPQSDLLTTVRESQAAVVDVVRSWTDLSQQFTHNLPPVAGVDISHLVDSVFDFAEQTLAAQRQFALALAGAAARQADTAVEVAESSARESLRGVEDLVGGGDDEGGDDEQEPRAREDDLQPQAGNGDGQQGQAEKQDSKPDRRPFEERSLEELRDRARDLDIEGRSAMSKDELVAALREHSK
jgi:hypothetical protein